MIDPEPDSPEDFRQRRRVLITALLVFAVFMLSLWWEWRDLPLGADPFP